MISRRAFVARLGLAGVGLPLLAHHGTGMYDMSHPTTVTGVVKRFEWTNPHAYIYLEVKDEKGNIGGVGDRNDGVESLEILWLVAEHRAARRRDQLYRWSGEKRRAHHAQFHHQAGGRPRNQVVRVCGSAREISAP